MKQKKMGYGVAAMAALYALTASASTQVSPDRTITSIGAYGNMGYVVFSPAVPGLESCPYANGDIVYFDWGTNPDAKTMYATAMAAYLAGQKVGFGVTGCVPGSAPIAYRIDVKP